MHGAGVHDDKGMHIEWKNKIKDEKRKKTREEYLKKIIEHVVRVEVKKDEIEKLLKKVPSDVLELYKAIEEQVL